MKLYKSKKCFKGKNELFKRLLDKHNLILLQNHNILLRKYFIIDKKDKEIIYRKYSKKEINNNDLILFKGSFKEAFKWMCDKEYDRISKELEKRYGKRKRKAN